jgi:hypothetical protein
MPTPEMLRKSGLLALLPHDLNSSIDAFYDILPIGITNSESNESDEKRFHDWLNCYGSVSVVHPHCYLQCVVCVQIIGCICMLALNPTLTSNGKQGSSNRAPLRFSQSHGAEVKWEDVGSDVHGFVVHAVSLQDGGVFR